jgi:hypothetical protein
MSTKTVLNRSSEVTPDWINGSTVEENDKVYFVGRSTPLKKELEKNQLAGWSLEQADEEALRNVLGAVARYIQSDVSSGFKEQTSESQQNGVSNSRSQAEQTLFLRSSASFQGLKVQYMYYERYSDTLRINKKKVAAEYVHYWVRYEIPATEINLAREALARGESIVEAEKHYFEDLKNQFNNELLRLENLDILDREQEYMTAYSEIINIRARLKALSTYNDSFINQETDPALAEEGRKKLEDYNQVLETIESVVRNFDPVDIQKQRYQFLIRGLDSQISEMTATIERNNAEIEDLKAAHGGLVYRMQTRIDVLEQEKAAVQNTLKEYTEAVKGDIEELRKQGITLVSQNVFVSYPVKPAEALVPAAGGTAAFYAAGKLVNNQDFISFAVMTGKNTFNRAEGGLEKAAVSVSFTEAAEYCNWLSKLYGLAECYTLSSGQVSKYDKSKNGYRLPERLEILAGLNSGALERAVLQENGAWCSDSDDNGNARYVYRLAAQTPNQDAAVSLGRSFPPSLSDQEIGFMVVRNAQN